MTMGKKPRDREELKKRTQAFALRVIKLTQSLPQRGIGLGIGKRLLRCGTSVGANYRSACRARSTADFIAKTGIVEEGADESLYWMELLIESGLIPATRLQPLMDEANQLLAITVSSILTARKRARNA